MNNKFLIIGLMLTCFLIGQCQSKKTNAKDFIGKEYRDLDEFDFFKGFKENGGVVLTSPDHQDFVLSDYSNDKQIFITLSTTRRMSDGKARYKLRDIVEFTGSTKNRFMSPVACNLNGKSDTIILAVCESPADKEVEKYGVLKAWKLNWATELLEPIETKGVECLNPTYGVDTN